MTTTETTSPRLWHDLAEFIDANKRAGHHFFDPDTARFFRSRWDDPRMYGGRFFITSEQQFEDSDGRRAPRRYTVRIARPDGTTGGEIGEPDGFQAFDSLAVARVAAEAAAAGYAEARLLDDPNLVMARYGAAVDSIRNAYQQGRALRRYEANLAPDRWGNTAADYLRADADRYQAQADAKRAEADALEAAAREIAR